MCFFFSPAKRFFENSPELFKKHILEEQEHDFELLSEQISSWNWSCMSSYQQPLFEWDEKQWRFQSLISALRPFVINFLLIPF